MLLDVRIKVDYKIEEMTQKDWEGVAEVSIYIITGISHL
jgi:hypothetical protein